MQPSFIGTVQDLWFHLSYLLGFAKQPAENNMKRKRQMLAAETLAKRPQTVNAHICNYTLIST